MTHGRIDALNVIDLEMRLKRMELDLVGGEPISTPTCSAAARCRDGN